MFFGKLIKVKLKKKILNWDIETIIELLIAVIQDNVQLSPEENYSLTKPFRWEKILQL